MSDGTRTRGRRDHNPELYQLSYAHQGDCGANLAANRTAPKGLDPTRCARYNGCMPFVGFIETPRSSGDDGDGAREPWLLSALEWVLPWPALIVWLCVASRYADGWLGVGLIYLAIGLCAWRGLKALPADGLKQDRQ